MGCCGGKPKPKRPPQKGVAPKERRASAANTSAAKPPLAVKPASPSSDAPAKNGAVSSPKEPPPKQPDPVELAEEERERRLQELFKMDPPKLPPYDEAADTELGVLSVFDAHFRLPMGSLKAIGSLRIIAKRWKKNATERVSQGGSTPTSPLVPAPQMMLSDIAVVNDTLVIDSARGNGTPVPVGNGQTAKEGAPHPFATPAPPPVKKPETEEEAEHLRKMETEKNHDERTRLIMKGRKLLDDRMANLGITQVVMCDDGNCQFRALSHQMYATEDHHRVLREAAVCYMRDNPEEFQAYGEALAGDWETFLLDMSSPGTWGNELTLRALADAMRVTVHVLTSTEGGYGGHPYIRYDPANPLQPPRHAFVSYISPIHYNSIIVDADRTLNSTFNLTALKLISPPNSASPTFPPTRRGVGTSPTSPGQRASPAFGTPRGTTKVSPRAETASEAPRAETAPEAPRAEPTPEVSEPASEVPPTAEPAPEETGTKGPPEEPGEGEEEKEEEVAKEEAAKEGGRRKAKQVTTPRVSSPRVTSPRVGTAPPKGTANRKAKGKGSAPATGAGTGKAKPGAKRAAKKAAGKGEGNTTPDDQPIEEIELSDSKTSTARYVSLSGSAMSKTLEKALSPASESLSPATKPTPSPPVSSPPTQPTPADPELCAAGKASPANTPLSGKIPSPEGKVLSPVDKALSPSAKPHNDSGASLSITALPEPRGSVEDAPDRAAPHAAEIVVSPSTTLSPSDRAVSLGASPPERKVLSPAEIVITPADDGMTPSVFQISPPTTSVTPNDVPVDAILRAPTPLEKVSPKLSTISALTDLSATGGGSSSGSPAERTLGASPSHEVKDPSPAARTLSAGRTVSGSATSQSGHGAPVARTTSGMSSTSSQQTPVATASA